MSELYRPAPTELLTKGVAKTAAGRVNSLRVTNNNAAVRFFHLYDKKYIPTASVVAVGTLTSDATAPSDGDTVQIGSTIYTYKTTLTEVAASGTLTSDATAPSDGDTVTIDTTTYTFKTTLTVPHVANEVLIGGSAAAALDNLKSAVNLTDNTGTAYSSNTKIHPTVTATTNTNTTQVFVAKVPGTAGNSIVTTENGSHTSFGAATLAGGVDSVANEVLIGVSAAVALDNLGFAINANGGTGNFGGAGIEFSYATVAHPDVVATTNTNTTQVVQAKKPGSKGNTIATLETSSHLSWGAAVLASGSGDNALVRSYAIPAGTANNPGTLMLGTDYLAPYITFENGIAWSISTTDKIFTDSATSTEHTVELNYS